VENPVTFRYEDSSVLNFAIKSTFLVLYSITTIATIGLLSQGEISYAIEPGLIFLLETPILLETFFPERTEDIVSTEQSSTQD